ncbi:pentatricopeptide repeat-containing protein [Quercus suber]|uniref:Pentatricopeptide repeat-containing protein n=1 Tax=Quercus suber TaxID=58331 RepID=A0AAW0L3Z5_QUESU
MNNALKKEGMIEMAHKLRGMMSSVPHSMKLPNAYSRDRDARTTSIMRKAKGMSDLLKTCKDPREFKYHNSSENAVSIVNRLPLPTSLFTPSRNITGNYSRNASKTENVTSSLLSVPGNPLIKWPSLPHQPHCPPSHPINNPNPNQNLDPNVSQNDFSTISKLLTDPNISRGPALEAALDQTRVEPDPTLLQALFDRFDLSPKLLLFVWAEKHPGFQSPAMLFNSMINVLAKSSHWFLIELLWFQGTHLLSSSDVFVIPMLWYTFVGMTQPAIRAFEFACNLDPICKSG